jgi:MtaA/CmuA family methyltransferase
MTGRERLLALIDGQEADCLPFVPITMLFAAARAGVSFRDYATDYRVMAEAQLRVAGEFGHDHLTTMSDPAREAADFGASVEYFPDQPPAIIEAQALLSDKSSLNHLNLPDPLGGGRMHDRVLAIDLLRRRTGNDKAVEGWVEGPCAEAADLRGINHLMLDFFDDPVFVRDLFDLVVENALRFARPQVEAGADWIGVGDAAASLIGPKLYEQYVWPYEKKLVDGLHDMGARVRLHICGNIRKIFRGIGALGCEIVDLDYLAPVREAREAMGPDQVLLGNLDPVSILRNGTPDSITREIAQCHADAGPRFIVSAGCEVVRDTPLENFRALAEYAKRHNPTQYQRTEQWIST